MWFLFNKLLRVFLFYFEKKSFTHLINSGMNFGCKGTIKAECYIMQTKNGYSIVSSLAFQTSKRQTRFILAVQVDAIRILNLTNSQWIIRITWLVLNFCEMFPAKTTMWRQNLPYIRIQSINRALLVRSFFCGHYKIILR